MDQNGNLVTPRYISRDDIVLIKEIGMDFCLIQWCPKDGDLLGYGSTPAGMDTTQSSDVKKTTIAKKTPLERQVMRQKEVQEALKKIQNNLTTMCWETSLGQELSKVIVFDGVSEQDGKRKKGIDSLSWGKTQRNTV